MTRFTTRPGAPGTAPLKELGVESEPVIYPRAGYSLHERQHVRDVLERVVARFSQRV